MGVDLTLMPLISEDFWCAHDLIRIERRRELWADVQGLYQKETPEPVRCFVATLDNGENGYGELKQDPYGDPLKYTTAGALASLKAHPAVQDNWQNRAVWAYLAEMPPDYPIVLYWH